MTIDLACDDDGQHNIISQLGYKMYNPNSFIYNIIPLNIK